jgi:hypothetical protein
MSLLRRSAVGLLFGWGILAFVPACLAADAAKAAAKTASAVAEKPRTVGHRLPPYYKDVVTEDQRQAIYRIQEEYGPKIGEAKARLADLQQQQAAKIEALLSPDQKQKLAQLHATAAAKRKAKAATKK